MVRTRPGGELVEVSMDVVASYEVSALHQITKGNDAGTVMST